MHWQTDDQASRAPAGDCLMTRVFNWFDELKQRVPVK
jgi:hypothetical protein